MVDIRCALLYPPTTDPTGGYHSLSYLATAVRAERDYDISIIDANIEAVLWCAREGSIASIQNRLNDTLTRLRRRATWTKSNFRAYREAVFGTHLTSASIATAMATLRDPEAFWHYDRYYDAARTVARWLDVLKAQVKPVVGDGASSLKANLNSSAFYRDAATLQTFGGPFRDYFREELIPRLERDGVNVVGIGVTYRSQFPGALYLVSQLRTLLPRTRLVLGGTHISQVWKFSRQSDAFLSLLKLVDAIVVGEGEHALIDVLDAYAGGREPEGQGILTKNRPTPDSKWAPRYENVDALTTPSFGDLPWDLYLSPERMVCYSPTRGCYWDRCTFCDYGLADDRPTSPWRQRSVEHVVEDLEAISREAKFVYLAVDVIAPAYLVRLARALIDRRVNIRWGAEIRLERYFNDENCALLRDSGCIAASVGFESGNQRVLDLIDKGTRVDEVKRVVRTLSNAGIGVQIMGFTGFPSESYSEAVESIRLLEELREHWTFGGLGTFGLTAGAIVAKQPDKFGLVSVRTRSQDDIHSQLDFDEAVPSKSPEEQLDIDRRCAQLIHPLQLDRPFMGGIDTPHTYFYLERFGAATRALLETGLGVETDDARVRLEGVVLTDPPSAVWRFLAEVGTRGHADERSTVVVTADGRLLACPRFVGSLAPLLDGQHSTAEVASLASANLRVSRAGCALALGFLQQSRLLRFMPR